MANETIKFNKIKSSNLDHVLSLVMLKLDSLLYNVALASLFLPTVPTHRWPLDHKYLHSTNNIMRLHTKT